MTRIFQYLNPDDRLEHTCDYCSKRASYHLYDIDDVNNINIPGTDIYLCGDHLDMHTSYQENEVLQELQPV